MTDSAVSHSRVADLRREAAPLTRRRASLEAKRAAAVRDRDAARARDDFAASNKASGVVDELTRAIADIDAQLAPVMSEIDARDTAARRVADEADRIRARDEAGKALAAARDAYLIARTAAASAFQHHVTTLFNAREDVVVAAQELRALGGSVVAHDVTIDGRSVGLVSLNRARPFYGNLPRLGEFGDLVDRMAMDPAERKVREGTNTIPFNPAVNQ